MSNTSHQMPEVEGILSFIVREVHELLETHAEHVQGVGETLISKIFPPLLNGTVTM